MLLLDPRVDPSAQNNKAIRIASENGHIEVVEILLKDPRVDPSVKNNKAARRARLYGHLAVATRLLRDPRSAKVKARGN